MKKEALPIIQLKKEYSLAMKGIAILLMIVHHGLGLPEIWFEQGLGYGQLEIGGKLLYQWIANPTKICVSIFAFLTGWSYCIHDTPTWKYGIRKVLQLLLQYWFVLFALFYPAGYLVSNYIPLSKREVLWNIFSINYRAISFSWYVLFYVLCMLTLPVIVKLITGRKVADIVILPFIFTCVLNVLNHVVIEKWYLIADLRDYFYWMPVVWVGYLAANYRLFDWLQEKLYRVPRLVYGGVVVFIPIARGMFLELFCMNMDVIYAPIFVFAWMMLLKDTTKIFKVLCELGKYSMYVWFVHSIFFWEQTRRVFQPIVYSVNNPAITLALILGISLLIAIPMHWLWQRFSKFVAKTDLRKHNNQ